MTVATRFYDPSLPKRIRWPLTVFVLVTYLLPSLFSSYRAWVQVKSLDLVVPRSVLQTGDTIHVHAVSWARTWVTVDLLLIQGSRTDTLATRIIPKNHNASIDPRVRRDSIDLVLTPELLSGYDRGPAIIKATAIGGPQWLRTPPPLIRQKAVRLETSGGTRGA
jgi:hypothetical protein